MLVQIQKGWLCVRKHVAIFSQSRHGPVCDPSPLVQSHAPLRPLGCVHQPYRIIRRPFPHHYQDSGDREYKVCLHHWQNIPRMIMNLDCFVLGIMRIWSGNTELARAMVTLLWMTQSLSSAPANRNVVCHKRISMLQNYIFQFWLIHFCIQKTILIEFMVKTFKASDSGLSITIYACVLTSSVKSTSRFIN